MHPGSFSYHFDAETDRILESGAEVLFVLALTNHSFAGTCLNPNCLITTTRDSPDTVTVSVLFYEMADGLSET